MHTNDHFILREITRQDLPHINAWRNHRDVLQWLGAPFRWVNIETDEEWFDAYQKTRSTQVRTMIISKEGNEPIGMANLTSIDWVARSAEFSIQIGSIAHWDQGVGTFATKALLDQAFINLNLNRVHLTVRADNARAIHLYGKVGFQREGVMRQALFKEGKYHDMVMMSLLRDDLCHGTVATSPTNKEICEVCGGNR